MSPEQRKVLITLAISGESESIESLVEAVGIQRTELIRILASLTENGIVASVSPDNSGAADILEQDELQTDPGQAVAQPKDEPAAPQAVIHALPLQVAPTEEPKEAAWAPAAEEYPQKEPSEQIDLGQEHIEQDETEAIPQDADLGLMELDRYLETLRSLNYYERLELPADTSKIQVRRTYYNLVAKYHPDQNRDQDEQISGLLADIFILLTQAYETLRSNKQRKLYDRTIPEFSGAEESEEDEALANIFEGVDEDLPIPEQTEEQSPGWSFYQTALEEFQLGNYTAADLNFKLAVGMEPGRTEYEEGLNKTREILTTQLVEEFRREGERLEEERRFQAAISAFNRAVELDPHDADLRYAQARIRFLKTMDRLRAEEDVSWALALDPGHLDALLLMGRIQAWKGNIEMAVKTFKEVLAIVPGHPKAHQALELFENNPDKI